MTDTVSEAAVKKAAMAMAGIHATKHWRLWEDDARAALEAALPLLVAGEMERCAKIAEAAGLPATETLDSDQREIGGMIAAAIRSDKGGE